VGGGLSAIPETPGESFTVARVKRSFFEQSTIGAIYTLRSTTLDAAGVAPVDRHSAGVDLNLFTSRFLGDKNLQFEAFYVRNSNPTPSADFSSGDLSARGVRLDFPNDVWQGHLSYRELGNEYDPAVGFVTRNGYRRVEPQIRWRPRAPSVSWIRRFNFSAQLRNLATLDTGRLEERQWQFTVFGMDFESGDNFSINATHQFDDLDYDFDIHDGILIQQGLYTNWQYSLRARTASRRRVSANVTVEDEGFWNGDRRRYQLGLTVRPNPGFSISTDYELNDVQLPQGNFQVKLARLTGAWDISPWVSISGNIQYDDNSDIVGLFTRAHWILRPGNDLYLVYTNNWRNLQADPLGRDFEMLSRGGSVKFNYTYRL
jgi:hypothetical protein